MTQSASPPSVEGTAEGTAPQPQPSGGNPFAGQQAPALSPAVPVAPARGANLALGLLAALLGALVSAGVYGAIVGATEREIGYAALGVGALVGFCAGRAGRSHPVLPVAAGVLALGAVCLGQLLGIALIFSDEFGVSATSMFVDHFDGLTRAWKETADPMTFLFFAIGAVTAFSTAKKTGA